METADQRSPHTPIDIDLRPPKDEDLEKIRTGWEKAVPHDSLENWEWAGRSFRDVVLPAKKEGISRVAISDNKVVGFACVFGRSLCAIYVEEEYRRQGIGQMLLDSMIDFARKKRWSKIAVTTPHPWMGTVSGLDARYVEALGFLEGCGFQKERCIHDVEADFEDIERAAQERPLYRNDFILSGCYPGLWSTSESR